MEDISFEEYVIFKKFMAAKSASGESAQNVQGKFVFLYHTLQLEFASLPCLFVIRKEYVINEQLHHLYLDILYLVST